MIDKGLIFDGLVFATPRDRALYIGTLVRDRPRWLKDHPEAWETLEQAERRAIRSAPRETRGALTELNSGGGADGRSNSQDSAKAADVRPKGRAPSDRVAPPAIAPSRASNVGDEVTIDGRRYVSAERFASMLKISLRTLSRWCKEQGSPPKVKVGSKAFFAADTIPKWTSSRQTAPVAGRHKNEIC